MTGWAQRQAEDAADELEALRKDAERYRWIKADHGRAVWMLFRFPPRRPWVDAIDEVDDAIDAAMKDKP